MILENYIQSPGWRLFSNIENTLEVETSADVEITVVPEDDYQDILEQIENEERLDEEKDAVENPDESEAQHFLRKKIRSKVKEQREEMISGALFCKLYNGTVLASEENRESNGLRVFFRPTNEIISIKINDVEMIDSLDDRNSLVIPANLIGKLSVEGSDSTLHINNLVAGENAGNNDVYDLCGRRVLTNATADQIRQLRSGLYIINGRKVIIK